MLYRGTQLSLFTTDPYEEKVNKEDYEEVRFVINSANFRQQLITAFTESGYKVGIELEKKKNKVNEYNYIISIGGYKDNGKIKS